MPRLNHIAVFPVLPSWEYITLTMQL